MRYSNILACLLLVGVSLGLIGLSLMAIAPAFGETVRSVKMLLGG